MQAVSIILILISLGITVVPVGAVVYLYRDDLPALIIPAEVQGLIDGESSSLFFADNATSESGFIMPTYVSSTVDKSAKTFTVTVNVTNFLNYGLSLNAINATVLDQNGTESASIHLSAPVTLQAGQWQLVTVSGQWTQAAENYFNDQSDATATSFTLSNIVFDVNSIVIRNNQSMLLGEQISQANLLGDGSGFGGFGGGKGGAGPVDTSED